MVEARLNFFLIGAPKAGTTLLHKRLSQHPQVYLSPLKEPNYYATDIDPSRFSSAFRANTKLDTAEYLARKPLASRQVGFVRDAAQYRTLFEGVQPEHRTVGECSTSYLWSREAALRVADAHPEARILVVLRNPVDRLYSHWMMARMYGFTDLDLMTAVSRDQNHPDPGWGRSELYVEAGRYADALKRWLKAFPPSQVKVLFSDQLSDAETWHQLQEWLDLDGPIPEVEGNRANSAGRARMEALNHWLTRTGLKGELGGWLPAPWKRWLKRVWYTSDGLPALSKADREQLFSLFESDVKALEKLLNVDLPHWRP